ncbi:serine hydrolase domain-containing protein [Actinoplanes sp. NEAU-A12]|uniref:Serine hydrolase domain-containing protein n=1 Tax=Actinoplanes sandaracinus TaxID=3045177 RepID=A0ABT6WRU1_9ACTN|nr:serine hydrolase domain-containing protein [Actinoplanes sandaracinus]MDI6102466.1 serine hydrolase domain-containing protein [Actinoplanes sandaracinus]
MSDLDELTRQAVQKLEPRRHGVVVAALAGDTTEIRGSGGLTASSRLEIGSVTKVFTALTLARLVEAGSVGLDQPLSDFLPAPAGITLRHLAQHTSGLPRLPKGLMLRVLLRRGMKDPYVDCTTDFLIENLSRVRPGEPGKRFRYSNFGAGLLGLALARHTGLGYGELVAREILHPLGLTGTGIGGPVVQGHKGNGTTPAGPWNLADLAGAGGLRSTVTDVVAFVRAHLEDSVLTPAVAVALGAEHRVNPIMSVRLGWMAQRLHASQGGHLQIFHNGQTAGCYSFAGFDPEKRVGVVVLSDTSRPVDNVALELLKGLRSRA